MSTLRQAAKTKTTASKAKTSTSSSTLRTKAASRPKVSKPSHVMSDAALKQEQNYKPPKFNVEPPPLQFGYIRAFSRIPALRRRGDPNAA